MHHSDDCQMLPLALVETYEVLQLGRNYSQKNLSHPTNGLSFHQFHLGWPHSFIFIYLFIFIHLFLLFTIGFENDPSYRPEFTEDKLALCWAQNWAHQITVLWTDCEPIWKIVFSTNHNKCLWLSTLIHALLLKWDLKFKQKPNDPSQPSVCWKDGIWTLRRSLIYGCMTAAVLYLFGLEELPCSRGRVETFLK